MRWLIGFLKRASDKLRRTGQEEGPLPLTTDVKARCAGCLSEAGSLTFLVSHLTFMRRRPLSEREVADVGRSVGDFCAAMRKRRACPRGVGEATCLAVALGQIERVREVERTSPGQRLATWCCLFVGVAESGVVDVRSRRE